VSNRIKDVAKTVDDIKDIYRRAEGHELVVEGIRDLSSIVQE